MATRIGLIFTIFWCDLGIVWNLLGISLTKFNGNLNYIRLIPLYDMHLMSLQVEMSKNWPIALKLALHQLFSD
jgi:hypothetical protein